MVTIDEQFDFQPRESLEDLASIDVSVRETDSRLRVLPRIGPLFGLPPRPRRPPAVNLVRGQWVRWHLNFRFSSAAGTQDWSYWLDTFNIAYGPVDPEAFLGSPTFLVDERGPLR